MKAEFRQAPFQPIWYWLLLHPHNGQVIAESFDTYSRRRDAKRGLLRFLKGMKKGRGGAGVSESPFDSEEFDHLCYAYRTAPGHKPLEVAAAFEALCAYGRKALLQHQPAPTPADRQGFAPFEYEERN